MWRFFEKGVNKGTDTKRGPRTILCTGSLSFLIIVQPFWGGLNRHEVIEATDTPHS